jgi:hypothetical protein
MNSKSEDSILPSHQSGSAVRKSRENALAKKITSTYESTAFSIPAVDQLNGILPDFNNRLSPERNLGLSPARQPRLCSETHSRLFSSSCVGLSSSQSREILPQKLEMPVGKGLEIKPDQAGRTLMETGLGSFIGADLPIAPLGSRLITPKTIDEKSMSAEQEKE